MTGAPLFDVLALATLAGLSIPVGGLLGRIDTLWPNWASNEARHTVLAFGAGALLAAVALVLVPDGMEDVPGLWAVAAFVAGGIVFYLLDRAIQRRGGLASQLMAMTLDYVPEAMALGVMLAVDPRKALLLAGLIALQNLPESFNAYREIETSPHSPGPGKLLGLLCAMVLIGPLAGLAGVLWLVEAPMALGAIMLFAGGGIVYLVFQDVAPQVPLDKHWGPPLGAVAGFAIGLTGTILVQG